ncbi:MAG: diguanylate cyclase [Clostridiales bacterium]|nr:diguanylate cyclase [Clostridiales bacterium]
MDAYNISNIKNILIYGDETNYQLERQALDRSGLFNVRTTSSSDDFYHVLESNIIHLIIFDSKIGSDVIKSLIKEIYYKGITKVPMVLIVDHETIDERYEYFNIGITNFYERGQVSYFVKMIQRIDKEETYRKSFKGMSIAVLDDDKLQLRILKDILDRNGIVDIDLFAHPYELLNSETIYDIYLIDLILPDIDGEIVMYELRKQYENAVIIGISSIEKQSTIAKVLAIGANDYLIKPVNEPVFMAKLYNYGKNLILRKENEMKTKVLQDLAIKDGLTTLYNHRHMQELLEQFVKQAKRYLRPLSLMMLDIDDFKALNDTYGHQFGDEVLARISKVLLQSIREQDIVGRYGGEEFVIILPETTAEQGAIIGQRIQKNISEMVFKYDVNITFSGGIAEFEKNVEQLIFDADHLMYSAKRTGKNRILYLLEEKDYLETYETC